ncbi:sugar ABC transporter permease [Chromatiales bacterium (ex Bugula neritina AB1)]|nr:sugar ABC transporter permease [Chromatiales bacterium (ex Bugula neritina AB1)]
MNTPKTSSRGRRHPLLRNLTAKLAATPMIATALFIFVGCSAWSVVYSFTSSKSLPRERFVGLKQYDRLFDSSRWMESMENIAVYGICALVFSLGVGFLLAVAMDQKIRFENTFRTIFLYPFALSFIVTGLVWQWVLNPDFGIQQVIRDLGFTTFEFNLLASREYSVYALVIAGLWQGTGFVMALMLAGLRSIDQDIWKAARVDGIPAWRTYLFIVIPMMRPVFITTLVIIASGIVKVYDLVVALTGGGPGISSEMPAKYVYDYMFGRANLGQALAASTVMLATVLIILIPWAYLEFSQKKESSHA